MPTLYLDCTLDGSIDVDDAEREHGLYDFFRYGLEPSRSSITSLHPDSVTRVHGADGSAFQLTSVGIETIPSFWDGWVSSEAPHLSSDRRDDQRFGPR